MLTLIFVHIIDDSSTVVSALKNASPFKDTLFHKTVLHNTLEVALMKGHLPLKDAFAWM